MRRNILVVLGLIALTIGLAPVAATRTQPSTEAGRRIVVLSDLHMGVGRDPSGAWHPYEDFRWATELELFLRALAAEGEAGTDLILNGDTFELLQADTTECTYEDATLGCTEPAALARLERVLGAHTAEIAALGAFARTGANREGVGPRLTRIRRPFAAGKGRRCRPGSHRSGRPMRPDSTRGRIAGSGLPSGKSGSLVRHRCSTASPTA